MLHVLKSLGSAASDADRDLSWRAASSLPGAGADCDDAARPPDATGSASTRASHSKPHRRMKRISMRRIFMTRVASSFLIGVAGMYSSFHPLYLLTRFGGKSTGILKILTLGRCNKFCHQLRFSFKSSSMSARLSGTFSVDFGVFLSSGHKSQWNIKI